MLSLTHHNLTEVPFLWGGGGGGGGGAESALFTIKKIKIKEERKKTRHNLHLLDVASKGWKWNWKSLTGTHMHYPLSGTSGSNR